MDISRIYHISYGYDIYIVTDIYIILQCTSDVPIFQMSVLEISPQQYPQHGEIHSALGVRESASENVRRLVQFHCSCCCERGWWMCCIAHHRPDPTVAPGFFAFSLFLSSKIGLQSDPGAFQIVFSVFFLPCWCPVNHRFLAPSLRDEKFGDTTSWPRTVTKEPTVYDCFMRSWWVDYGWIMIYR